MNTTHFWLIRHGETQWNADRRLQGWRDIRLNAAGTGQAERLAQCLRPPAFNSRIDVIVSSDLSRALETARIGASHFELPIETEAYLRERCYGIYEGQEWAKLKTARTGQNGVNFHEPDQDVEEGESLRAFESRVIMAFEDLAQRYIGRNVLVFTHGGVIDIVWRKATQVSLEALRPDPILNASINQFSIGPDNEWQLICWGQTHHLEVDALDDVI